MTSNGWPHKWHLVDDRQKIQDYELCRLHGLKSAGYYTLDDLRKGLKTGKILAEGGDETIRRFIQHHGSTEDLLAMEKEKEKEKKKEKQLSGFARTELNKEITYFE